MRIPVQFLGLYLVASGISGVIDHLWHQPVLGVVLNLFNRLIVERLDVLVGYEVATNLALSAVGAVVMFAAAARSTRVAT